MAKAKRRAGKKRAARKTARRKPAARRAAKRKGTGAAKPASPAAPRPVVIPGAWPFPMGSKP